MSRPQSGPSASLPSEAVSLQDEPILSRYEPVIGLEVHCQLSTETKLFCRCTTKFGALPNHNTCPVCLGMPGVLPVINAKAVEYALKLALAVGAKVNETSTFARKQYFYPDLPKGYQITQYDLPYCEGGGIKLQNGKFVGLIRIHMEEDAGKNVHGDSASYVDYNRAGIPLCEIVSEPVISTPEDAAEYLRRLHSLVRHLDISDGNMEEGSFRCDANVSIRPRGQKAFGTRCEIKNLNSFRNIERAIRYEILRQADILDDGGKIEQQTLLFDAASGKTQAMRSKEESHDYRYFPEPDLRPLVVSNELLQRVKDSLPELPSEMVERFKTSFGLTDQDASLLTSDKDLAHYFETAVQESSGKVAAKIVANWVTTEFLREVNEKQWNIATAPLTAKSFGGLLALIGDGTISGKIAKTVFQEMVEKGGSAADIVKAKGLIQVSDEGAIVAIVAKVLAANPAQVAEYVAGKDKVYGFLVGQVMRESGGKMNPALVNQLLRQKLDEQKGS